MFRCGSQSPCTLLTWLAVSTSLPTTVAQAKHVLWSSLGVVLRPPTILVVGARQGYKNGEHVFLTLAATPSLYGIPQLVVVGDALNEDERRMLLGESSRDCVLQRGFVGRHPLHHTCVCVCVCVSQTLKCRGFTWVPSRTKNWRRCIHCPRCS